MMPSQEHVLVSQPHMAVQGPALDGPVGAEGALVGPLPSVGHVVVPEGAFVVELLLADGALESLASTRRPPPLCCRGL